MIALLAVTACGGSLDSSEGGFGLGELSAEDTAEVFASAGVAPEPMNGQLRVQDNGCFTWSGEQADGAWIVWPESAGLDGENGGQVMLDGGERVGDGSPLRGAGAVVALEDLPGGSNPDSYFASFGGYCGADAAGVVVFTEVASSR